MNKVRADETTCAQIISLYIDKEKEQKRVQVQEIDLNLQPNLYKSQLEKQFYNIMDKPNPELTEESKMKLMKNTLFNEQTKESLEKQQLITEIITSNPCKIKFQELIDKIDKKLQQKRILTKFFRQFLQNSGGMSFTNLENQLTDIDSKRQKEIEIFTVKFLQEFKAQKNYFKESNFTLFEVGNFLAEQQVTQQQLEVIAQFLNKVKKLFNLKNGNRENTFVLDPNLKLVVQLLNDVLDIQCQKAIYENEVINDCIDKILSDLDRLATQHHPENQHIILIFERNVIIDTALKYFTSIDNELFEWIAAIEKLHKFLIETEEKQLSLPKIYQYLQLLLGKITEKDIMQQNAQASPTLKFLSKVPQQDSQKKDFKKILEGNQVSPTKDQETDSLISLFNNKKPETQSQLLASNNFGGTVTSHQDVPDNEIKLQRFDPLKESYNQSYMQASQAPAKKFMPLSISSAFYHPTYEFKEHNYDPEEEKQRIEQIELEQLKIKQEEDEEDPNLRLSGMLKKQKNMEQTLRMSQNKLFAPSNDEIENQFQQQLSSLKDTVNSQYYKPKHIGLGKFKPTSDKFLDYQTYFPTDYYSNIISGNQQEKAENKKDWYLRSHHIETLTGNNQFLKFILEHPFSQKDNVMDTKYAAFLQALPKHNAFTQPDEIQQSQETKQQLIDNLENKIQELKKDLVMHKYNAYVSNEQQKQMSPQEFKKINQMQNYHDSIQKNEKKELLAGTYQSLLGDLRKQEKEILNIKRGTEITSVGPPKDKWWEDKTNEFNDNLKKFDQQHSNKKDYYNDLFQHLSVKELY